MQKKNGWTGKRGVYKGNSLTPKQRREQDAIMQLMKKATAAEKTDGLTVEERFKRWVDIDDQP
jgi:hypothetical protein